MPISNTLNLFIITFANTKESNYVGMVIYTTMNLELAYVTKRTAYKNYSSIVEQFRHAWLQTSFTKFLKKSSSSECMINL